MKLALPDLISPSYFPAIAAIELGKFKNEGFDVSLDLIAPTEQTFAALRDGEVDFVASEAHSVLSAFPEWNGAKLLCAQSQGLHWFLVMRSDLAAERGDVNAVKGRTIGAAYLVGLALRYLLVQAGINLERDGVTITAVPGAQGRGANVGVAAAKALEERTIDGFWANGMGAEVAVSRGVGKIVLDVRRGAGPKSCIAITMPAIVTTDRLIQRSPDAAAAAIRAVMAAQTELRQNPEISTDIGNRLFPPTEAGLIAELIRRDTPFYDPAISQRFVTDMTAFARSVGLLQGPLRYEQVVAKQFTSLWRRDEAGGNSDHCIDPTLKT